VWYASGGRVKIGGSLDLLNQGGETLTDGSGGGQLSAGNTTIAGTLNVAGQASFKDGATVGNNLTVNGLTAIQTTTNAANAFQIINSGNASILNVSTIGNSANLVTNGNFEYDETGWIISGGNSISKSSTQAYIGSGSLLASLNSGGTSGARYNLTLSDSTAYSYSFYAQLSSGTFIDMRFGYNNGSSDTDCAQDQTVVIGSWTRYQCTFTTPASHTGTPYVYVKQGSAAAHDIYIDAVQLIPGSDIGGYYDGKINSGAAIFSGPLTAQNDTNSTTGFNVLNATGQAMFTIDTINSAVKIGGGNVNPGATPALLVLDYKNTSGDPTAVDGAMYYNSSTSTFRCAQAGTWVSCVGGLLSSNTSVSTAVTSTSETNFDRNYSLPANYCVAGRTIRITAQGTYTSDAANNLTLKVKMGSTVLGSTGAQAVGNAVTNREWRAEFQVICNAAPGASVATENQGLATLFTTDATTSKLLEMSNTSTVNIATNAAQTIQMSAQWSAGTNSITMRQFLVEGMGP
jgi:hypothetical protein